MKDLLSVEGISLIVMLSNVAIGVLMAFVGKDLRNLKTEFKHDLEKFKNEMRDDFDKRYYLADVQLRDRENYTDFCKRTHERIDKLENKVEVLQETLQRRIG